MLATRLTIALLLFACITGCARPMLATRPSTSESPPVSRALFHTVPVAFSAESRPIIGSTLGNGPRRLYLIAGIHGNEPEGARILDDLLKELADSDLPRLCTLRIIHDMNPDGLLAASRYNSRGIDLNRNWPATNFRPSHRTGPEPLSEPETRAIYEDLRAFTPEAVVVFHSARSEPFVNFDGPAAEMAEAFAAAATAAAREHGESSWRIVPSMGYPTPGSLGSWIGVDQQIPILTIEFRRGQDPDSTLRAAVAGMLAVAQHVNGRAR